MTGIAPVTALRPSLVTADSPEVDDLRMMTAAEVCDLLEVSQGTLHRWDEEGYGPLRIRLSGSTVRYRLVEVRAFVAELVERQAAERAARCERRAPESKAVSS